MKKLKLPSVLNKLVKIFLLRLGGTLAFWLRKNCQTQMFFFFPYYHVGGAERVHADIVSLFDKNKPWVVVAEQSTSNAYKKNFADSGRLLDVQGLIDNPISKLVFFGYLAATINRQHHPILLGANTHHYYEFLDYLQPHVTCIDLLHAFGAGLEDASLPYVSRLNKRIVITPKTLHDLSLQYAANHLPEALLDRILLIENAVRTPDLYPEKECSETINVLYVGRGSVEKRVHLVGEIARRCRGRNLPIKFMIVGNVSDALRDQHPDDCALIGEIHDYAEMGSYYAKSNILLITSSREGFPMAIMEAMAHGVVPITTNVGGVSFHIHDGINGFLVNNDQAEASLVDSFVDILQKLCTEKNLLAKVSINTFNYAKEKFSFDYFEENYRKLMLKSLQLDD